MLYLVSNQRELFKRNFNTISLGKAIEMLSNLKEISLDTETQGLDPYTKKLLLLQLGNEEFQIVFDIESYGYNIPEELKRFLSESKATFIIQNAKFDLKFLFRQGIVLTKVYDTMLAETILTNGLEYSGRDLKTLASKYCGIELDKSVRGKIIRQGITDEVIEYAANDIKYLKEIKRKQLKRAEELELTVAIDLDNSFVVVLAYTEYCGIKLDWDKWMKRAEKNEIKLEEYRKKLNDMIYEDGFGEYFTGMEDMFNGEEYCILNWNSPKQVVELFKKYGIDVEMRVNGKVKESVAENNVKKQAKDFPIIKTYLEYKDIQKDISTYGKNWKSYINPVTGRIHTTFQQLMNTGRLSSGNRRDNTPNLQNIPRDAETRSCFIPEEGCVLVDADFSGQESILLANFSKEPNLINFYKRGFDDLHSYVAFLIYPELQTCSLEDLTPEVLHNIKKNYPTKRSIAKTAVFIISYGGRAPAIAKKCDISFEQGKEVYDSYFKSFPKMNEYFEYCFKETVHLGYVLFNNITKRKYFFDKNSNDFFKYRGKRLSDPEIIRRYNIAKSEVERVSRNYKIQGSGADTTKYAAILFFKEILKRDWFMKVKIINQVHDELLIECPEELVEEVSELLLECMDTAGKLFCRIVPLHAEVLTGKHWVH